MNSNVRAGSSPALSTRRDCPKSNFGQFFFVFHIDFWINTKTCGPAKKFTAKHANFFSAVFAGSLLSSQGYTLRPLRNPLRTLRLNKGSGAKVGDYAKRLDNLNRKKSIFLTPLN